MPQAGSMIRSPSFGAMSSTSRSMMCWGVRNWPFVPEVARLDSMYSYRSPVMSRFLMSRSLISSMVFRRVDGLLIPNEASWNKAARVPVPMVFKNGNTRVAMVSCSSVGSPICMRFFQRRSSCSVVKMISSSWTGTPRSFFWSNSFWRSPSWRMNRR